METVSVGVIFQVFVIVFMLFIVEGLIFGLGVAVGRMYENKSRGLFGVKKGKISVGQPAPDEQDPMAAFVGKQFLPPEWNAVGPEVKQGAESYEDAVRQVDRQVQRFIDSTVFGRGPVRARMEGGDDDE